MAKTNGIRSSKKIAKLASKKLTDKRSAKHTKKLAGSVLSNRAKKSR